MASIVEPVQSCILPTNKVNGIHITIVYTAKNNIDAKRVEIEDDLKKNKDIVDNLSHYLPFGLTDKDAEVLAKSQAIVENRTKRLEELIRCQKRLENMISQFKEGH